MALVDEARAELRKSPAGAEGWREIYAAALRRARREAEPGSMVGLGTLAATRLLSEGRETQALSQLDFALAAAGTPAEATHVLAIRASALLYAGHVEAAYEALTEADRTTGLDIAAATELDIYRGVLDCAALRPVDLASLAAFALQADATGHENWCSGLLRWVISALIATGRANDAAPWIDFLEAAAEAANHPWRIADAFVLRTAAAPSHDHDAPFEHVPFMAAEHAVNLATLSLYRALHGMTGAAPESFLAAIEQHSATLPSSQRATIAGFGMLIRALQGERVTTVKPPERPTLLNLPGALAAAEAIAHTGPTAGALAWASWLNGVPRHIVTSATWPVPVAFVRGLLALRLGRRTRGEAELHAVHRAGARVADAPCLDCARRALVTLKQDEAIAPGEEDDAALLPPHAFGAARFARANEARPAERELTRRELETLSLLNQNLSYREAADALGLSWRTVQSHARNAYRKLGAHRLNNAIAEARRRGLI